MRVRQPRDPGRAALRGYQQGRRLVPASGQGPDRPTRDQALDQAVAAWAADVERGAESGLFAWRRANVAELNHRARAAMIDAGRIDVVTQVEAPGGRWYGPGDRIVTLAPNREGRLVTSQRGTGNRHRHRRERDGPGGSGH